jgi:hypothetical protein
MMCDPLVKKAGSGNRGKLFLAISHHRCFLRRDVEETLHHVPLSELDLWVQSVISAILLLLLNYSIPVNVYWVLAATAACLCSPCV